MRTWKIEFSGHRNIGRPKLRWSDVIRRKNEEKTSKDRRRLRPENILCILGHYIFGHISDKGPEAIQSFVHAFYRK